MYLPIVRDPESADPRAHDGARRQRANPRASAAVFVCACAACGSGTPVSSRRCRSWIGDGRRALRLAAQPRRLRPVAECAHCAELV